MLDDVSPSSDDGDRRLLDAGDVAALLGVPKSWVYAETSAGRMPHVALGRYRRYRRDALDRWLVERERGPVRRTS
jgi:excisionase family DNA binding protein